MEKIIWSYWDFPPRNNRPEVFCKKGVLRNSAKFTGKHHLFFIKKETPALVFSCEFWEISKNIFSYRLPPAAASVLKKKFKANKRIDKGHSLKSELETGDPRPWDPRLWDPGPWDLGPWALGLATLGHWILTPGILAMGHWDTGTLGPCD